VRSLWSHRFLFKDKQAQSLTGSGNDLPDFGRAANFLLRATAKSIQPVCAFASTVLWLDRDDIANAIARQMAPLTGTLFAVLTACGGRRLWLFLAP
jgi:hypothetical protein